MNPVLVAAVRTSTVISGMLSAEIAGKQGTLPRYVVLGSGLTNEETEKTEERVNSRVQPAE